MQTFDQSLLGLYKNGTIDLREAMGRVYDASRPATHDRAAHDGARGEQAAAGQ